MVRESKHKSRAGERQALAGDIGRAMQAYQRATQAFDDVVGERLGLNPADMRGLDWLSEGPMSTTRLSEAAGLSPAATTALVDRLERKGFVRRVRSTTDRRQVNVEMTDQGRQRVWAMYGPLVEEGFGLLGDFDAAQLAAMRDHLGLMRDLTERHRQQLIDERTTADG